MYAFSFSFPANAPSSARAIKGDLEAAIGDEFGTYVEIKEVPIMIKNDTAVYLNWWYKVANARMPQGSISEFLKNATRKYMKQYLDNITEEEARELARMNEEAGIPTLEAFALEIEDLIKA